jgi:SAM-dependent methyltransferase
MTSSADERHPVHRETPALHDTEARFHDQWAATTRLEDVSVELALEARTAPENRFILDRMGDLNGKRILDVGPGWGETSVYFALRGAEVTMVDLSPGMIDFARRLARSRGVEVRGVVSPAEELDVPAEYFDLVYMGNLLHHITERDRLLERARAALRPARWLALLVGSARLQSGNRRVPAVGHGGADAGRATSLESRPPANAPLLRRCRPSRVLDPLPGHLLQVLFRRPARPQPSPVLEAGPSRP